MPPVGRKQEVRVLTGTPTEILAQSQALALTLSKHDIFGAIAVALIPDQSPTKFAVAVVVESDITLP